jgi:hypothetical protein
LRVIYSSSGRREEAIKSLTWLRGPLANLETELIWIRCRVETVDNYQTRCGDFIQPSILRPVLIAVGLMVISQLSGINAALFYAYDIFNSSTSSLDSLVSTAILYSILVIVDDFADQLGVGKQGPRGATGISIAGPPGPKGARGTDGMDGKRAVSLLGPPGLQGPEGKRGPPGEKGHSIAGMGLNSIQMHSNRFVQHRTVNLRRPVIIIEQPTFVFQRLR